jgi:hypothetical protein
VLPSNALSCWTPLIIHRFLGFLKTRLYWKNSRCCKLETRNAPHQASRFHPMFSSVSCLDITPTRMRDKFVVLGVTHFRSHAIAGSWFQLKRLRSAQIGLHQRKSIARKFPVVLLNATAMSPTRTVCVHPHGL